MLGVHALIGLGEAAITVGALAFLIASRRDLLNVGQQAPARTTANLVVIGLGLALAVAALSPLASGDPDGLYRVAADLGFDARALSPVFEVFAGYTIPVVGDEALSKITAVAVGTLIVFGLVLLIGRWQRRAAA
jgi:cobalt/nickel transport system permease protein